MKPVTIKEAQWKAPSGYVWGGYTYRGEFIHNQERSDLEKDIARREGIPVEELDLTIEPNRELREAAKKAAERKRTQGKRLPGADQVHYGYDE